MKPKKAKKHIEKLVGGEDDYAASHAWYINNGFAALGTQYNQWAEQVFWGGYQLHLCMLDAAGTCKQYSTAYDRLTKFNPGWKGFYPSQYTVQEKIDMEGNTEDKVISDMAELKNLRNKKNAEKFYFAGIKYNLSSIKLKHETNDDWGWEAFGNAKAEKEGIYIRKTLDAYVIVNFALNGHPDRQVYGSESVVANYMSKWIKSQLLDEDAESTYLKEVDDAIDNAF